MAVALQGDASAFRLPEVLTFLSTTRKSGTFTFVNGVREARLFFDLVHVDNEKPSLLLVHESDCVALMLVDDLDQLGNVRL